MGVSVKLARLKSLAWLFILCCLFLTNYILQYLGISTAFTRNYLDDLLAMPIILGLAREAIRILHKKPRWELEFSMLVVSFLTVSVLFEVILPRYYEHHTGDLIDVFCYAAGVVIYQMCSEAS
jgi:hypothetical protein